MRADVAGASFLRSQRKLEDERIFSPCSVLVVCACLIVCAEALGTISRASRSMEVCGGERRSRWDGVRGGKWGGVGAL